MDWITIDTLKTVGGASAAVALVTAVIKYLVPSVTGRVTQLIALGLSIIVAAVIGDWSSAEKGLVTVLNAFVIFSAAVGLDQIVNYGQTCKFRLMSITHFGESRSPISVDVDQ